MNQSRYRNNIPWEKMSFPDIVKKTWQKLNPFAESSVIGSQRPIAGLMYGEENSLFDRNYDLEPREIPVRNYRTANLLIEFRDECGLAATATNITIGGIYSSANPSDDIGFALSKYLGDGTPVDPDVYRIGSKLIDEVIGGDTLYRAAEEMIYYGDAFASVGINWTKKQIERIMFLPTWEMFRVETNDKLLWGFEQRHHLSDNTGIKFHPVECVHWRHRPQQIYGLSQYYECRYDWLLLKELQQNLGQATRVLAHNPLIHKLPCDYGQTAISDYRDAYQSRVNSGKVITDFFVPDGADIKRVSNFNPNLEGMQEIINHVLYQIARQSQVPPWLLGLPGLGVRSDNSYTGERYFNEYILDWRSQMTKGIRHLCDLELMLNGIKNADYRIIWPQRYIPGNQERIDKQSDADTGNAGIVDLDDSASISSIHSMCKDAGFIRESEHFQEAKPARNIGRRITARALSDFQNQQQELYKKRYA